MAMCNVKGDTCRDKTTEDYQVRYWDIVYSRVYNTQYISFYCALIKCDDSFLLQNAILQKNVYTMIYENLNI